MLSFSKTAPWYWFVGADRTRVWSSASGGYVQLTDPAYQAWLTAGGVTSVSSSLEDITAVLRREIPKSTVHARLDALGKLGTVFTALQSSPRAYADWFSPNWPNVYADDAQLLGLLQAVGLSAQDIAAVTA